MQMQTRMRTAAQGCTHDIGFSALYLGFQAYVQVMGLRRPLAMRAPLRPFRKGRPPKPRAPKAPPADALGCAPWAVPSLPAAAGALTFMEFECALSQDGREECMHAWG